MSEGTLEEYFNTQIPPSRGVEIIKFWETLFGLLDELREIHSEGSGYLDITPESIHFVKDISDGDSSLRLELTIADSYVMRMGSVGSTLRERELSDYDSPDTYMEYGHAAGRQEQAFRITSSADIWSLGCIYSEAAIWIADGRAGLTEYRRQRQKEANLASPASPFHDGTQVLQSVLAAHADIEERLRRSDNITKNVLDAMVQEMLWEEDRPSAKALLRKADVLLTKARQKSGIGAGLRSEMIRPGSRHRREYSPPNLPSPTQPLPPLPKRAAPALNSVPVRNRPSEVVSGTSQDRTFKPQTRSPAKGDDPAILKSLSHPELQEDGNNTLQNLGTARGTIRGLPNSDLPYHPSTKEPPVPSRTAHISHSDVHHRPTPNQGRPRALRTQESHKPTTRPTKPQNQNSSQDYDARPPIPDDLPSATRKLFIDTATSQLSLEHRYHDLHDIVPTRAKSTASSHQSSNYSQPVRSPTLENDSFIDALSYIPTADEITQEPKPSKRGIGFSLFPTRSSHEPSVHQKRIHDVSVPKSPSVLSATVAPNLEYISLNTCLEWKKANKKVKKHANVPPLLSATMMEELSRRDHAFIIDDSASMAPVSADVQRAFEALSYLVKGMSTEGTELFFTISYDTYRRKDTSELCTHLSTHPLQGQTNISYRLNLQMQAYRLKLLRAKTPPKTKSKKPSTAPFVPAKVRPLSLYILTNGEWFGEGDRGVEDVLDVVRTMGEFLKSEGLDAGSASVQFVSFGGSAGAMGRMRRLGRESAGNEGLAVDCERWTGNVVRMLRGAVDGCRDGGGISELA